jgi:hypothetical protein
MVMEEAISVLSLAPDPTDSALGDAAQVTPALHSCATAVYSLLVSVEENARDLQTASEARSSFNRHSFTSLDFPGFDDSQDKVLRIGRRRGSILSSPTSLNVTKPLLRLSAMVVPVDVFAPVRELAIDLSFTPPDWHRSDAGAAMLWLLEPLNHGILTT